MTAMLFGKDRGPIYSHYDMDRPGNVDPVVDFASKGWSQEDMAFLLAHKIAPGQAEASDMMGAGIRTRQEESSSLRAFLQLLAPSTQTGLNQSESSLSRGQQSTSSFFQQRNPRRTQSQSKAALVGIIIWFLFILISLLMSVLGK
ncbi:MAG: hypothetical protein ACYDHF_08250 [Candidatus Cryosericum sp.]